MEISKIEKKNNTKKSMKAKLVLWNDNNIDKSLARLSNIKRDMIQITNLEKRTLLPILQ